MPTGNMQGVYPILITPFDEQSRIDEASLRSLVEFNVQAGVHGLGIALASEIFKLNEAERDQVIRTVVDQVAGRVPVVVNSGGAGTDLAVFYSRRAEELGADALMVLPPSFMPAAADEVVGFYRAISDAVNVPIFIQDITNTPVSADLARRIAEECEWVQYIKVESLPVTAKVADMVAKASHVLTVFGGAGGGYFVEEMRRGSVGTMPFCTQPEAFVEVWDLYAEGDEAGARRVFEQVILPLNRVAGQGAGLFFHVHKEVLRRRSVIETAKVRSPAPTMDEMTGRELDQVIERLYPESAG